MLFIWSGNQDNFQFRQEASACVLTTRDLVASVHVGTDEKILLEVCEISQNNNRLRVPAADISLLGCPCFFSTILELEMPSRRLISCIRFVPMGATFEVALTQRDKILAISVLL